MCAKSGTEIEQKGEVTTFDVAAALLFLPFMMVVPTLIFCLGAAMAITGDNGGVVWGAPLMLLAAAPWAYLFLTTRDGDPGSKGGCCD